MMRERVPGADKVVLSAHNHNDLGLAVANTLAAINAGVRQVESTINGIGERAGNASLEEAVMAIRTRNDRMGFANNIKTRNILKVSRLLATITGFDVQPNKAIVGRNAFAHEAGIHQDGVLKNAATYEIMTPESVGWTKSNLVMGKHSGRAAFRDKLRSLGYEIGDNHLNVAFRRFKEIADRKKVVYDEDIMALVDDEVMRDHERIRFVSLDVHAGSKAAPAGRAGAGGGRRDRSRRRHRRRAGRCDLQGDPRDLPAQGEARAVLGRRGDRGHRRAGQDHGPAGGERQDGRRAGGRPRHHRRLGPRLRARPEQADGQAPADRAASPVGIIPVDREADRYARGVGGAAAREIMGLF